MHSIKGLHISPYFALQPFFSVYNNVLSLIKLYYSYQKKRGKKRSSNDHKSASFDRLLRNLPEFCTCAPFKLKDSCHVMTIQNRKLPDDSATIFYRSHKESCKIVISPLLFHAGTHTHSLSFSSSIFFLLIHSIVSNEQLTPCIFLSYDFSRLQIFPLSSSSLSIISIAMVSLTPHRDHHRC